MLINILQQAKMIGDRKIQLSQQILDATEQQSKKLKIAYQNHIESTNEQNSILNNNNNSNDTDSESGSHRPLWKRKFMINLEQNEKSNSNERDRKKLVQRNINSNNDNGKKMRINNDTSTIPPDETTYCLCSQLSYGSMILCDSKTCGIKWFHFNCVNLTNTPKGKWFCPNCRENRT
ncbi:unnamed protein product [Rotaria sp. Silwood2]|nr:unnamed protein product [Rotaria sp. Silwood2]CAF4182206.1 unnamed protein product [Rotaria sp. Silwood2]